MGVGTMLRMALVLGVLVLLASGAVGAETFPFAIPWQSTGASIVDVSSLNPAPLTGQSRIVARQGHFYDATGQRVRFVGTDLAAGACFPPKEQAEAIAARLHRFGFNCVRLHHMDAPWATPNMFSITGETYAKRTDSLDPQSLDRLDYLIYQFKLHGIYVDMNLHVARGFNAADGFPDADRLPEMGKVVGYFDPEMIAREKLYARQLLTHVNPYTKTSYVEEPTVALVEITNEDSLLGSAHELRSLPDHYRAGLVTGWNQYLRTRYATTARLLKAWNVEAQPLGVNLLTNPRFANGATGWLLEQHEGTKAELTTEAIPPGGVVPPGRALRLGKLQLNGTDWHLQFHQLGLDLKAGQSYTLSFAARAERPRAMSVSVMLDQGPWRNVGLDERIGLTTGWQCYSFTFTAHDTVATHARVTFVFGNDASDVLLADVSLSTGGGAVGLGPGQSLEAGTVPLVTVHESPWGRDFVSYLMRVEADFSTGMRTYLKETLKLRALVTCSQTSYGGLGGVVRESKMDWVDMHAYWQHPGFPRRSWDSNDYMIDNTPMVRAQDGGTLPGLAMYRVEGKPFTVTEYDHPAPSEYAAEMVPMIFAYAAWQDWDGVFLFCYQGGVDNWDRNYIDGFFDQSEHPGKLAFVPAAAEMFLRGTLAPATGRQALRVPLDQVPSLVAQGTDYSFWSRAARATDTAPPPDLIARASAIRLAPGHGPLRLENWRQGGPVGAWLNWDRSDPARARFTVADERVRAAVGFLAGSPIELLGLTLTAQPGPRGFASLVLVSRDKQPIGASRSLLLTAVDKVENTGLEWNAARTFAQHSWEHGPTLVEAPRAHLELTTTLAKATVYALDAAGQRTATVPSALKGQRLSFDIGPEYHALWYEIVAE